MFVKYITDYLYKIGIDAKEKRTANLKALCEVNNNAIYLDCGCNDGKLTLALARKIGTKKIFGLDRDKNAMNIAKKKGINVSSADLNKKMPFKDKTFDVITNVEVIEHLYDTDMFIKELYRVCKKGGYILMATENLASWHNIFALILGMQPSTGPHISNYYPIGFHPLKEKHLEEAGNPRVWNSDKHINVVTRDALRKLCIAYGFKLEDEKSSGFYPFLGFISNLFASFDKNHALTVLLKLRKV